MKKLLVIYDDNNELTNQLFAPLNSLRPTLMLRSGMSEIWSRIKNRFPGYDLALECAPEFEALVSRQTGLPVNKGAWTGYDRVVLFNSLAIPSFEFVAAIDSCDLDTAFVSGDMAGAVVVGEASELISVDRAKSLSHQSDYQFESYGAIWDLMLANPANIELDFALARKSSSELFAQDKTGALSSCYFVERDRVFVHPEAEVAPGVVFDASSGPIYLESGVVVEAGTHIVGPFYAGADCKLLGGKLAGSSLGPVCQVAGELEESVLQGFVNKHHAGFIGHSFVGEWVNFGAMTTNSDLKNNYSTVRVSQGGTLRDTGANKVGSFIGDHTKFGIGTLLNTGINIGAFCNVFGGALVTDKEVQPFSWGGSEWTRYDFDKALETASRSMARRNQTLDDEAIKLVRRLIANL